MHVRCTSGGSTSRAYKLYYVVQLCTLGQSGSSRARVHGHTVWLCARAGYHEGTASIARATRQWQCTRDAGDRATGANGPGRGCEQ